MPSPDRPPVVSWEASGVRPYRCYRLLLDGVPQFIAVHHCGHPTAIWPYYINAAGARITDGNGHGFRTLELAKARAVELFGKGGAA